MSTGGDPTVAVQAGTPSILVFVDRLTPAKLDAMASDAGVTELKSVSALDGSASLSALPVSLASAKAGWLQWRPDAPGSTMLASVLPWLALAAAALAVFVALVFKHAARAAKLIADSASRLARAHEHAEHQAKHDVGTGLPNRLALVQRLDDILSTDGTRLVLIYADLDRFKPINDALGHGAGDYVLAEVARRLRSVVSDRDIVARVGGDEFVIAVADLAEHDTVALCKRLLAAVIAPMTWEGAQIYVGAFDGRRDGADRRHVHA